MSHLPLWFKRQIPQDKRYYRVKTLLENLKLNTVCKEAKCPNVGECYSSGTATFMILGDTCTRACGFCSVKTGRPLSVDNGEPLRLKKAVEALELRHVVITSVTRDDLNDGGASIFGAVIDQLKKIPTLNSIEVLIPDFKGNTANIQTIIDANPTIINHNIETMPRLYTTVRAGANFERSLNLLSFVKKMNSNIITKSGMMLGFDETYQEVLDTDECVQE